MRKNWVILSLIFFILAVSLTLTAIFLYRNLPITELKVLSIKKDAQKIQMETSIGELVFSLPAEFSIELFAKNLPGARVIAQDALGNFWISQPSEGAVSLVEVKNGKAININRVFTKLNNPHGLAIDPQDGALLYIAETNKISRVKLDSEEASLEKIIDLPTGGRHFTRTIAFGPDDRLYVSIGSSCDVCIEEDEHRAAIYSMERDGSDFKKTVVGRDGPGETNKVVLLGFYGANLKVGFGSLGGRDEFGEDHVLTKASGNILYEIDGKRVAVAGSGGSLTPPLRVEGNYFVFRSAELFCSETRDNENSEKNRSNDDENDGALTHTYWMMKVEPVYVEAPPASAV